MADTDTKDPSDRKEKVIHTRVPPVLDEELKSQAARLGISVSNLIRNVLNNTFSLVEDVILDSATIATRNTKPDPGAARSAVLGEHAPQTIDVAPTATPTPTILGWQKLTLNINAVCQECNAILPRGSEGAIAITQPPTTGAFLCLSCLSEVKP